MLNTLLRQPMAILGALGFISLLSGVAKIHDDLRFLIDVFQTMTHPIWEWTLGPLVRRLGLPFPWWVKDYLTMGLIIGGANIRYMSVVLRRLSMPRLPAWTKAKMMVVNTMAWPVAIVAMGLYFDRSLEAQRAATADEIAEAARLQRPDISKDQMKSVAEAVVDRSFGELLAQKRVYFEAMLWVAMFLCGNYGLLIHDAVK